MVIRYLAIIVATFTVALLSCGHSRAAGSTPGVSPFWAAVAQCETQSQWDWGAEHRRNEGTNYEGGVGFFWGSWQLWAGHLGLLARYPHAYLAPPAVQARVAHYGLVVWRDPMSGGHGYWGCIAQHAYIRALPGR